MKNKTSSKGLKPKSQPEKLPRLGIVNLTRVWQTGQHEQATNWQSKRPVIRS